MLRALSREEKKNTGTKGIFRRLFPFFSLFAPFGFFRSGNLQGNERVLRRIFYYREFRFNFAAWPGEMRGEFFFIWKFPSLIIFVSWEFELSPGEFRLIWLRFENLIRWKIELDLLDAFSSTISYFHHLHKYFSFNI